MATTITTNMDIPTTTKAACCTQPGADFTIALEDIPVPKPSHGEVLIRLSVTGICYSDLHYMLEDLPTLRMVSQYGIRSPGHEGIGVVVSRGEGVTDQDLKLGERVGLKPVWSSCNMCELCVSEREMYCKRAVQTGLHVAGTYQQYVLGRVEHVVRIPEGVSDQVAAPVMCAGATIYRAVSFPMILPMVSFLSWVGDDVRAGLTWGT